MEQKKYSIIYADPPWRYEMKKGQGVAENHYSTMGTEEICEKNCALFLWVTFPQLPEAFRVIKAWGFRYKTVAFVWIKLNRSGQGYFLAWDIGLALMQKYVFWQQEESQKEYQKSVSAYYQPARGA